MKTLHRTLMGLALGLAPLASAQTGVSDDRVSLPSGPGSFEGIGENVSVNANMGLLTHSVPVVVPAGYPGLTPDLSLRYSSGSGAGPVGVGWSMELPSIERLTVRGLPEYTTDDEFTANGSEQLVKVSDSPVPTYRARMEKGFVRYRWYGAAGGAQGYWTAEYPDGRVGYFGADREGNLVANSRIGGDEGTFRYHLTEMTDRYGHWIRYTYTKYGNVGLPLHIGWGHEGDSPRYETTFVWQTRTDQVSSCRGGFEELLEVRLSQINVRSEDETIRRYALAYEDMTTSGGVSRLHSVTTSGREGGQYPIVQTFEYSKALGEECTAANDCTAPYMVEVDGTLGVDLSAGNTTLIDLSGDGVPDIVDSTQLGAHKLFVSSLDGEGAHAFVAQNSAVGTQGSFDLSSKAVQVLDVNGDGYADVINATLGKALINRGGGDWDSLVSLWGSGDGGLPNDFEPADGELKSVRFLDADNDKKIDVIRSAGSGTDNNTTIFRGVGVGSYQTVTGVESIGLGFESGTLELNDMNGDGLLDPVQVTNSFVQYRLNYGRGRWGEWTAVSGFDFTDQEKVDAELEDMNGDSLADVVLVSGNVVKVWINRNGASFDAVRTYTSADVEGSIPTKESGTIVLYADMNGNGSSDVVWVTSAGQVSYLELFPVRPNLLARISNGIGKVQAITYGSSVSHQARDGGWKYPLPYPMTVVDAVDEWDELTGIHRRTEFEYHDGYYDGTEKQFRGYESVTLTLPGDGDVQGDARYVQTYDVGVNDPYRAGLLLELETWNGDTLQSVSKRTFDDCALTGVPESGLLFDVRHVCQTGVVDERREGADASEWVTLSETSEYDGYGNVSLGASLGVVAVGGGACEPCTSSGVAGTPCGDTCTGDERYLSTTYARPEDNADTWILSRPVRERTYGQAAADGGPAGAEYTEKLTYYDGDAFVGLPLGQLTAGTPTRVTERVSADGDVITTRRAKLDDHGNVIEEILPRGDVAMSDDHRRGWTYDATGLFIEESWVAVQGADGESRLLRRGYTWDPVWAKPVAATQWSVDGDVVSPGTYRYSYDEFGRLASLVRPGASDAKPSEVTTYELGFPVSRIITDSRSSVDGDLDLRTVACYDGHGRQYQARQRLGDDEWLVLGFTVFNQQGAERQVYDPFTASTGTCDAAQPSGVPSRTMVFDGLGRQIEVRQPAPTAGAVAPVERVVFGPLRSSFWDGEDTRDGGAYQGTPITHRMNGLEQVTSVERLLTPGGAPLVHRLAYDGLGRVTRITDPSGIAMTQTFDLAGRLTGIADPDRGTVTLTVDDSGNVIRSVDGDGRVVVRTYDALNRVLTEEEEGQPETRVTRTYDVVPEGCAPTKCTHVAGRLASTTYPLGDGTWGVDVMGYDSEGRAAYAARTIDGVTYETRSVLDHAGRPIREESPSGVAFETTYDGAGRVTSVVGTVNAVVWTPESELASIAFANGVTTTFAQDDLGRVTDILTETPSGTPIVALGYAWDFARNITSVTDGRADDGHPMRGATHTYDALYRLTSSTLDEGRPAFEETLTATWDASDRMLSYTSSLGDASPAHVGALTYGANASFPRAVSKAGDVGYGYDGAGRLVSRGNQTFEWDAQGRLVRTLTDGLETGRVTYGPGTARVRKVEGDADTLYVTGGFEVRDGTAVTSILLGKKRVAVVEQPAFAAIYYADLAPAVGGDQALSPDPDGLISAGDAWIATADASGALGLVSGTRTSAADDLLDASNARLLDGLGERRTYEHHDALGSVVATTDSTGAVTGRFELTPFGAPRYASGAESTRAVTGKERDANGLVSFGLRYLDPWVGRWTAPDVAFAAFLPGMVNDIADATTAYGYVGGNAASRVDPDGANDDPETVTPGNDLAANNGNSQVDANVMESVMEDFELDVALQNSELQMNWEPKTPGGPKPGGQGPGAPGPEAAGPQAEGAGPEGPADQAERAGSRHDQAEADAGGGGAGRQDGPVGR